MSFGAAKETEEQRTEIIKMAKENVAKFFEVAMIDSVLAGKLASLAANNGYDFTAEKLLELGAARPLSDTATGDAAGGGCYPGSKTKRY